MTPASSYFQYVAAALAAAMIALLPNFACSQELSVEARAELQELVDRRDYFELSDRLSKLNTQNDPELELMSAMCLRAFNQPTESNLELEKLLNSELPDTSVLFRVLKTKMENHMRLFEYNSAALTAEHILTLDAPELDSVMRADIENTGKLMSALADVSPQKTVISGESVIELVDGKLPLVIGEHHRNYITDTGANISVLMHTEAIALGLELIEGDIDVGTSTDLKVKADLAVAPLIRIGNAEYRNVVFLVFPDELLTFPQGFTIPGVIGFPVIEAMGEVTFYGRDSLRIAETTETNRERNLAFENLFMLLAINYEGEQLIGRFDTGADATMFYEPFFELLNEEILETGTMDTMKIGGVGGIREIPSYSLPALEFTVANREINLEDVGVITVAITDSMENYLYLNLGLDVFNKYTGYTIDFRSMSLTID